MATDCQWMHRILHHSLVGQGVACETNYTLQLFPDPQHNTAREQDKLGYHKVLLHRASSTRDTQTWLSHSGFVCLWKLNVATRFVIHRPSVWSSRNPLRFINFGGRGWKSFLYQRFLLVKALNTVKQTCLNISRCRSDHRWYSPYYIIYDQIMKQSLAGSWRLKSYKYTEGVIV